MLFAEQLMLVTSELRPSFKLDKNYVYIDWGPEFRADHSLNFPDLAAPGLYMELGSPSLNYLLANRVSGYFPKRLVNSHLGNGTLKLVPKAPTFCYAAYVVYPVEGDELLIETVLKNLRRIADSEHGN